MFSWADAGRFIANKTTVLLANKYSLLKRVKLCKNDLKIMIKVRYGFVKFCNEITIEKKSLNCKLERRIQFSISKL